MGIFDSSISLPKIDSGSGVSIVNAVFNNAIPSASQKFGEMVNKVNSTGVLKQFSSLASGINITDVFGNIGTTGTGQNDLVFSNLNGYSSSTGKVGTSYSDPVSQLFVKLQSSINTNDVIIFEAMPTISESNDAQYDELKPVHHPGALLKYISTNARSWNIANIRLISRTPSEATSNLKTINLIRSWTKPYFGYGTKNAVGDALFGAPPDVLYLSAYGSRNIEKTPVVLVRYSFDYQNDVTYIGCAEDAESGIQLGTPFPIVFTFSLDLREAWSAAEYSSFNLIEYKRGNMSGAFGVDTSESSNSGNSSQSEFGSGVTNVSYNDELSGNTAQTVETQKIYGLDPSVTDQKFGSQSAGKALGLTSGNTSVTNPSQGTKYCDTTTGETINVASKTDNKVFSTNGQVYENVSGPSGLYNI